MQLVAPGMIAHSHIVPQNPGRQKQSWNTPLLLLHNPWFRHGLGMQGPVGAIWIKQQCELETKLHNYIVYISKILPNSVGFRLL